MPNRACKIEDSFFKSQLVSIADDLLHRTNAKLDKKRKAAMGQYMTPSPVSSFMASLFKNVSGKIELLDAGAGVGALTAAFIQRCCEEKNSTESIKATVYEVEPVLLPCLREMQEFCGEVWTEWNRFNDGR